MSDRNRDPEPNSKPLPHSPEKSRDTEIEYGLEPGELDYMQYQPMNWAEMDEEKKRKAGRDWEKSRRRKLTQRIADRARPREKEYFIPSRLPGFGLRVRPSGSKTYVLVYKSYSRRFRRISIGNAKATTFDQAYDLALKHLHTIREGGDPQLERNRQITFSLDEMFRLYVSDHVRDVLSPAWGRETERLYERHVRRWLGKRPVVEITRRDLMDCIECGSTKNVKRTIRAVLSSLYSWAVSQDYIDENILAGAKRFGRPRPRQRALNDRELWAVWHASYSLNPPWGRFCRLLILTGQRRSEVAELHWREIDFDERVWNLPAERSKNRHDHSIPLTQQMMRFLEASSNKKGFLFGSPRVPDQPVVGFSKMVEKWKNEAGFYDWRLHDIRRTVASNMGRIGIDPHVIEAVLGHRSGVISGIAAVYNRYRYDNEKRDALERWNEYLQEVVCRNYEPLLDEDDEVEL